jgi:hypothetical protein
MTKRLRSAKRPKGRQPSGKGTVFDSFPPLDPSDPLFSRGWIIGEKRPRARSAPTKTTPETPPGWDICNCPEWLSIDEQWLGPDEGHPRMLLIYEEEALNRKAGK